jgi:hypothetical protein
MKIEKPDKALLCSACDGALAATKIIDGAPYCAHCGDNLLLKTIKKCIVNIEEAVVTIKVIPKGVLSAKKEIPD